MSCIFRRLGPGRCAAHAFNADDAGRLCSGSRFRPGHATQSLAEQLYCSAAAGIVGQRAGEPVVGTHEFGGEQRRRLVVKRCRRAFLRDDPGIEQYDAIGDRHGFDLVMRDMDCGQSQRYDQRAQPGARFLAQLGVEIGQRLVKQDHRGLINERASDGDALLLAA